MSKIARATSERSRRPIRRPLTYPGTGVDIDAKMSAISQFGTLAHRTFSSAVLTEIGSFGGLFDLSVLRIRCPVLVSSIDGVGTKLKIAFQTGIHDTVGRDLVNHCGNDVLVQGAVPLFFLDYLAIGRVRAKVLEAVVSGIASACRENGCALIGGETAEMPGSYRKGMAHITGGGFIDNVPRILPAGCSARIDPSAWRPPPIFDLIQSAGGVSDPEMRRTFNLGIGMILVAAPRPAERRRQRLRAGGEEVPVIGEIVRGNRRVHFGKARR